MTIKIEAKVKRLMHQHGISEIEAEAVLDRKSKGASKAELAALLDGIKRKKIKVTKLEYQYVEPKTPEEKREREARLQRIYFRLFDEVWRQMQERKGNRNM